MNRLLNLALLLCICSVNTSCGIYFSNPYHGKLTTNNNQPLVISANNKKMEFTPGDINVSVDLNLQQGNLVLAQNSKELLIPVIMARHTGGDTLVHPQGGDYSHVVYGANIVEDQNEPYEKIAKDYCSYSGFCNHDVNALNCGTSVYDAESNPGEYNNHQSDTSCTKTTVIKNSYISACPGIQAFREIWQDKKGLISLSFVEALGRGKVDADFFGQTRVYSELVNKQAIESCHKEW